MQDNPNDTASSQGGGGRMTGDEKLTVLGKPFDDLTVLDFWQWAYSDLRANNVRGVFAEWLVARLLGVPQAVRDSWEAWDIDVAGVKIEVKCSAYIQTWHKPGSRSSNIVFSGLRSKTYDYGTNVYSEKETYNSDLYIFCVQTCTEHSSWDATDLDQWRFYVLEKYSVQDAECKTLTLSRVREEAKRSGTSGEGPRAEGGVNAVNLRAVVLPLVKRIALRLSKLAAFAPIFQTPGFSFGKFATPPSVVPGVWMMPFYEFSDEAQSFRQVCNDYGWVRRGFDWGKWNGTSEAQAFWDNPEAIAIATSDQLAKLLTVLVRRERFCEGNLGQAFEHGVVTAIVKRAAVLVESCQQVEMPEFYIEEPEAKPSSLPVETEEERTERLMVEQRKDSYVRGYTAGLAGNDDTYPFESGTVESEAWSAGYKERLAEGAQSKDELS